MDANFLNKADIAYSNGLGCGAVVYLRKVYETITNNVANVTGVNRLNSKGKKRPFKEVLEEVDKKNRIIPVEFSNNSYELFRKLSNNIHEDSDDIEALSKYKSFKRLIVGVVESVRNNKEIIIAMNDVNLQGDDE